MPSAFTLSPNPTAVIKPQIITITGNYTVLITDGTILCDASGGSFTVTTPQGSAYAGQEFCIMKVDASSNSVTVTPATGLLNNASNFILTIPLTGIDVLPDGINSFIK